MVFLMDLEHGCSASVAGPHSRALSDVVDWIHILTESAKGLE